MHCSLRPAITLLAEATALHQVPDLLSVITG